MPHEYVPPKPTTMGAVVWVPGSWRWDGQNYIWIHGAYLEPPKPGQHWTPGSWAASRGEWYWTDGYWR